MCQVKGSFAIFLCYFLCQFNCWGQITVTGELHGDSEPLAFATVMLLQPTDSVMLHFAQSSAAGQFRFDEIEAGDYLLQVTYMGYKSYWQALAVSGQDIELGKITMLPSSDMLSTIEVTGELIPMKFGDDTVVYNTAAFPTMPGEVVEDLLKKMPGVEVERDGSVKAFGETVQNVLVDGKEFFGKDTRIATKNLDAQAVEKVEIFDKQSEQATFTGIADGREERSINLELKEDFKNGYFGNAKLGGGIENRFDSKVNLNRFRPDQSLSFIGLGNNINEQGFSMQDYMQFMGGIGGMLAGGGRSINIPVGMRQNDGVQRTWAGGLNVDHDFSSRTSLNFSGFYTDTRNDLLSQTKRANFGQVGLFDTDETNDQENLTTGIVANMRFKTKLDTFADLIIRANTNIGMSEMHSDYMSASYAMANSPINSTSNKYLATGRGRQFGGSLMYRRKFRKPGRTIVLNGEYDRQSDRGDTDVQSMNSFFMPNMSMSILDQEQYSRRRSNTGTGRLTLTEKLHARHALEWNAYIGNSETDYTNDFYDIESNMKVFNDLLSLGYSLTNSTYDAGLRWSFNHRKFNLSAGINYQDARLAGKVSGSDQVIRKQTTQWLPSVYLRSTGGTGSHISFEYRSNIIQPTIRQLQPVVDNRDPLNIYTGNPDLQAAKQHDVRFSFRRYDAFYFRLIQFRLGMEYTADQIANVVRLDSAFRRIVSPVNVKYERAMRGKIEFSNPIKPLGIMAKVDLRARLGRSILFVNEARNDLDRLTTDIRFSIENRKRDVVDASAGIAWRRNTNAYSVNDELDQVMEEVRLFADAKVKLGTTWDMRTGIERTEYSQSFNEERTIIPLWQASVSRYFTPLRKIKVTVSVHDLLNRNNGVRTRSALNYSSYTTSNVLGRYGLLTLSYNLKGFQKKDDALRIQL